MQIDRQSTAKLISELGAYGVSNIVRNLAPERETAFREIEIENHFTDGIRTLASKVLVRTQEHHWQTIGNLQLPSKQRDIALKIARNYFNGISDAVLYQDACPTAIVELKKYAEQGNLQMVKEDKRKMRFLTHFTGIIGFVGLYLTDTTTRLCATRLSQLNNELGRSPLAVSGPFRSKDSKWQWCFPVWAFGPEDHDLSDPQSLDMINKAQRLLELPLPLGGNTSISDV